MEARVDISTWILCKWKIGTKYIEQWPCFNIDCINPSAVYYCHLCSNIESVQENLSPDKQNLIRAFCTQNCFHKWHKMEEIAGNLTLNVGNTSLLWSFNEKKLKICYILELSRDLEFTYAAATESVCFQPFPLFRQVSKGGRRTKAVRVSSSIAVKQPTGYFFLQHKA